jgi:queuine tRNA-ribosyltransferase
MAVFLAVISCPTNYRLIVNTTFQTKLIKKHARLNARIMEMTTPHGTVLTPAFMTVGTRAVVNHMTPQDLQQANCQIILGGNTYHMLCSPGMEVIQRAGGMHPFMGWQGPMLTDSGGFQVWSLSQQGSICKIDQDGAHFKHPITKQVIHLTPQSSIATQKIIGADIIMAFDECTPDGSYEAALAAVERTHRWLILSKEAHTKNPHSAYGNRQALFGIIQGGKYKNLRDQSSEFILNMDLEGIAVGGCGMEVNIPETSEVLTHIMPMLPENKVRYTMGIGMKPQELINVVASGYDIFDCVAPTRNARHGALYHGKIVRTEDWLYFDTSEEDGRILIKKSKYAFDDKPIMEDCTCMTCQNHTRAYLHFLFKTNARAYCNFACIHNVHVMNTVCDAMRACI